MGRLNTSDGPGSRVPRPPKSSGRPRYPEAPDVPNGSGWPLEMTFKDIDPDTDPERFPGEPRDHGIYELHALGGGFLVTPESIVSVTLEGGDYLLATRPIWVARARTEDEERGLIIGWMADDDSHWDAICFNRADVFCPAPDADPIREMVKAGAPWTAEAVLRRDEIIAYIAAFEDWLVGRREVGA